MPCNGLKIPAMNCNLRLLRYLAEQSWGFSNMNGEKDEIDNGEIGFVAG